MNKFDVVEKIPIKDLAKALVTKTVSPRQALEEAGIITKSWHDNYFNWGRNALYFLFKNLPFKTIHFPAFSCPVLTAAAQAAGKQICLLEVDLNSFNLDFEKLPKKNIECLVVIHTFGNPLDISLLRKRYPKAFIIEDCAHAIFSKINGKFVGNSGDAALFSLYKQVANLNGALLLTKKPLPAKQKKEPLSVFWPRIVFKTAGWHHFLVNFLRRRYINTLENRTFSSAETSSFLVNNLFSLGFGKLKKDIEGRRKVAKYYFKAIKKSPYLEGQKPTKRSRSSFYQFVVRLKPKYFSIRDELVKNLRKKNIFLDRLWYSAPITEKGFAKFKKTCPVAHQLAQSVISLPTNPKLRKKDVVFLIEKLDREIINLL